MRKQIIAGIIGGVAFLIFNLLMGFTFGFSLILAGALFIGAQFIIPSYKKAKNKIMKHDEGHKLSSSLVKETVSEGKTKIARINDSARKIKSSTVKSKIKDIVNITEKILNDFEHDPSDIKTAKKFIVYYLDATVNIVEKYTELSLFKVHDPKVSESLRQAETLLGTIHEAFKKQLSHLLENDVMDLDVEMEVMEKTMKMEGFK